MSTLRATTLRATALGEPAARAGAPAAPRHPHLIVLAARLRAVLARDDLDARLARGADPRARPELAIRAAQLERPRQRRAVAGALRRAVAQATAPRPHTRSTNSLILPEPVREDADAVLALAARLECPAPAYAAGIAIARRLVTDGLDSPLYVAREPHTLARLARLAVSELSAFD